MDQNHVGLTAFGNEPQGQLFMKPVLIPSADPMDLKCPFNVSRLQCYPANRLIHIISFTYISIQNVFTICIAWLTCQNLKKAQNGTKCCAGVLYSQLMYVYMYIVAHFTILVQKNIARVFKRSSNYVKVD